MRIRKIFPLLLAGVIGTAAPMTTYAATTEEQIADAQAQKEAAQTQLAQQQANMDSLESKKQELESYLGELNAQYDELTSSISDLSIQAAEKEEELKSLEEKLQEAKQISDKQYEDMKKRIVYMYEHGSASMLELLLSSEDLAQFLNRGENIAQISKYDRDMLDKYKTLQAQIKEQEDAAEEEADSINSLLQTKSAKQQEVQALTASTSENIQSYIYQISSSQEEINALNTQISSADSSIYSLLQVAAQEEAAAEAAQAEAASSEGDSDGTGADDSDYAEDSYTEDSYTDDSSYSESGDSQASSDSSQSSASDTSSTSGSGTYLGTFTLTAYCNCAQCCGTAGNLTASGTVPTAGRTVAMAGVPFGTQLLINGNVYTVEDLGTPYGHVDIYFNSHSEALAFGLQSAEVYRLN
ncbi:MAG: hypothetical protein V8Q57_08025 [Blautia sp.]